MMKLRLPATVAAILIVSSTYSQVELVKDINTNTVSTIMREARPFGNKLLYTTSSDGSFDSQPNLWITDGTVGNNVPLSIGVASDHLLEYPIINGHLFMAVSSAIWKTDGTPDGTQLVKDGFSPNYGMRSFFQTGDSFYFVASDGTHGGELWHSDGTANGTHMVKDIYTAENNSDPNPLFYLDGILYFLATADGATSRLWRSDGTEGGTSIVADVPTKYARPVNIANAMYFIDGSFQLQKTDGTSTTVIKNTKLTTNLYFSPSLINVNGILYFTVYDDGLELWKTDGSVPGTERIKKISLVDDEYISDWNVVGDLLFFTFQDGSIFDTNHHGRELWRTDGTADGTFLVKDIFAGNKSSNPDEFAILGSELIFTAHDGTSLKLWSTDGTSNGTIALKSLDSPGTITYTTTFHEKVYFMYKSDNAGNLTLWETDGTTGNTIAVKDLGTEFYQAGIFPVAEKIFLNTSDNEHNELWVSDGSANGTQLVGRLGNVGSSSPADLIATNSHLFFVADDGTKGEELWASDGTTAGTLLLNDLNTIGSSYPSSLTEFNNKVYFKGSSDSQYGIWSTEGTPGSFQLVAPFDRTFGYGYERTIGATQSKLFFSGYDQTHGSELWSTDKTSGATGLVKDINAGFGWSEPAEFLNFKETIFFFASDKELWKSDGTESGTTLVKSISNDSTQFTQAIVAQDLFFFTTMNFSKGTVLWRSDGTVDGTFLLKEFPNLISASPTKFVLLNNTLFFIGHDNVAGEELWKSDGTIAGTLRVLDLNQSAEGSDISDLVVAKDLLFFTGDGTTEDKIWKSDGTAAGTTALSNLVTESTSVTPDHLISYHGFVLFTTEDTGETQFWITDGTETQKLFSPYQLRVESDFISLDNKLYFRGFSNENASELFSFKPGIILGFEPALDRQTNVYPNPARQTDIVTIEIPAQEGQFQIISMQGIPVQSNHFTQSKIVLREASLPPGIYIVRIKTTSGFFVSKLVIR